ncbi:hypothetical protein TNCV_2412071 [Trichonephila clavipes]|nr:hypothetical protein TNCV_2412071 [Trichonephila clavipes]
MVSSLPTEGKALRHALETSDSPRLNKFKVRKVMAFFDVQRPSLWSLRRRKSSSMPNGTSKHFISSIKQKNPGMLSPGVIILCVCQGPDP